MKKIFLFISVFCVCNCAVSQQRYVDIKTYDSLCYSVKNNIPKNVTYENKYKISNNFGDVEYLLNKLGISLKKLKKVNSKVFIVEDTIDDKKIGIECSKIIFKESNNLIEKQLSENWKLVGMGPSKAPTDIYYKIKDNNTIYLFSTNRRDIEDVGEVEITEVMEELFRKIE